MKLHRNVNPRKGSDPLESSAHVTVRCLSFSVIILLAGCSGRPARLKPPSISPRSAAESALTEYDSDGDGLLSKAELAKCPGMLGNMAAYDSNKDSTISKEEIVERLEYLTQFKTALTPLRARVTLNGKSLNEATVRLVPESYLGGGVKSAVGTTRGAGIASMSLREEDLPSGQSNYFGVHYGTYRVEITHPEKSIPAKYNTETTLGYETVVGNPLVTFEL